MNDDPMSDGAAIDRRAQELFDRERPRLTALAYRMTGTPDDADDVVQEVWLRWQRSDRSSIDVPEAWLTTVTTRLAIDRLTSARARREVYVGPWLPEPLGPDEPADPSDLVAAADSLSVGFLRVLETLAPVERAVFLLHDVFGYAFDEVAAAVDRTPAATRQIASRARQRVQAGRPRVDTQPDDVEALSAAFFGAVFEGDLDRLTTLLTDDVVHLSDGGAERHAARRPVVGADRVARFFINLASRYTADDELHQVMVNGQLGVYVVRSGEPFVLLVPSWRDRRVAEILAIVNPDKLTRFHQHWLAAPAS